MYIRHKWYHEQSVNRINQRDFMTYCGIQKHGHIGINLPYHQGSFPLLSSLFSFLFFGYKCVPGLGVPGTGDPCDSASTFRDYRCHHENHLLNVKASVVDCSQL